MTKEIKGTIHKPAAHKPAAEPDHPAAHKPAAEKTSVEVAIENAKDKDVKQAIKDAFPDHEYPNAGGFYTRSAAGKLTRVSGPEIGAEPPKMPHAPDNE